MCVYNLQAVAAAWNFLFFFGGGAIAQRIWGSQPVGSRGVAPVIWGTEAEAVCRHCLQILTAETIKI